MIDIYHLPRPTNLVPGGRYRRLQWDGAGGQAGFVAVEFLAYTACPAFVVVAQAQRRLRCPRDDLFESGEFRISDFELRIGEVTEERRRRPGP